MEDMEVDKMEFGQDDKEVDQGRRQRAVEKTYKQVDKAQAPKEDQMSAAQAMDILRHASELLCGNKISVENAFDLHGIDALRTLVFSDIVRDSARCNEGHFQNAGIGLEAGTRIYSKRVDAVYNLANTINYGQANRKPEGVDGHGQDQDGHGATQGEGDKDSRAYGVRSVKRQGEASAEATLVKDSELKQRVKEPTFDTDPFFVRTSRLIDENSAQGLLLHNLPVLYGNNIVFDSGVRPQSLLEQARENANVEDPVNRVTVDLALLPGVLDCFAAAKATHASISPGIEQLYNLLQPRPELPGLQIARGVDPEKLLQDALAANESARAEALRNVAERQALQHVEDAMEVDTHDGDAGDSQDSTGCRGGFDAGPDCGNDYETGLQFDRLGADEGDGGDCGGVGDSEGTPNGRDYSSGYAAGGEAGDDDGDDDDGAPHGLESRQRCNDADDINFNQPSARTYVDREADGADQAGSDDESALLSLLEGGASSLASTSAAQQKSWWRSYARTAAARTAAARPRPRPKLAKPEPLDWRASPQPLLEAVKLHTYKTARRDASAKLCMPLEEPPRREVLHSYFSAVPAVATRSFPVDGRGFSGLARTSSSAAVGGSSCGGFASSVQETWRALLIADYQRARQIRRGARAAARKSLGNAAAAAGAVPGGLDLDGPSVAGTDGNYGVPDGDEEYGVPGHGGEGLPGSGDVVDSLGPLDTAEGGGSYGGYEDDGGDEDDDDDDGGGGGSGVDRGLSAHYGTQDGRGPTLEELLQPSRRVRRLAVKYDKTAGVADVATLKANIEISLKVLASSRASHQMQSAPLAAPQLSFQSVLDQVSSIAASKADASTGGETKGPAPFTAGSGNSSSGSFLAGVSTHLAFICLLHLANEKGLALGSSDQLDSLMITGLGDLIDVR